MGSYVGKIYYMDTMGYIIQFDLFFCFHPYALLAPKNTDSLTLHLSILSPPEQRKKKPDLFPLYWLLNRDSYHGI